MFGYLKGTTSNGIGCMILASIGALLFLSAGSAVQSVGIMVGCLIAAYLNNMLGRRYALVSTGVISILGVIIEPTSAIGATARFNQLVVGKTIAAISMGLAANIIAIYLSETSTGAARGFAVSLYQNIMVIGFIAAAGTVTGSSTLDDPACYYIPMGLQLIAPTVRHEEAISSASKLFGTSTNGFDATDYVDKLAIAIEGEKASWLDLFHGADRRRALIAMDVQCLQQAQGSTYTNNYIVSFLQANGVFNVFPVIMGIHTGYSGIAVGGLLPDRFGRRPILMATAAFCGTCLTIIACLVVAFETPTTATSNAAIALVIIHQFGFGLHSPLVWITCAESAPTRNREKNEGYGNLGGKIGFIFGAFSFITVAWVWFFVPEMKGFSLEQLDHLYNSKVPTCKFKGYHFADAVLADKDEASVDLDTKGGMRQETETVERAT